MNNDQRQTLAKLEASIRELRIMVNEQRNEFERGQASIVTRSIWWGDNLSQQHSLLNELVLDVEQLAGKPAVACYGRSEYWRFNEADLDDAEDHDDLEAEDDELDEDADDEFDDEDFDEFDDLEDDEFDDADDMIEDEEEDEKEEEEEEEEEEDEEEEDEEEAEEGRHVPARYEPSPSRSESSDNAAAVGLGVLGLLLFGIPLGS